MANVNVKNLGVQLDGVNILEGLDLHVEDGEFLVLLGPSGCGKSTLLHSIAGLIDVQQGSIEIADKDVTHADPSARGIGMVFQSYALYPTMSVEKNMSFGLRISGTPKADIARRIQRVADMLQLAPLLQRKPAQLSGGQRQRVAIGRALVREAGVFLFDEPLSNLDAKLRAELRRELKLLHHRLGSTMIYVTHDQVEAMTLANRIVVMKAGKIQQIGTPDEVYARPRSLFVAGFLGSPAMHFLPGQLDAERVFHCGELRLPLPDYPFEQTPRAGQEVILGVRAEHVQLDDAGPFRAPIELLEPMGNHQVLWLRCAGHLLSCLEHQHRPLQTGDFVSFRLAQERLSLFDPQTEQRL